MVFGATVELATGRRRPTVTYQIVGEDEADIRAGLISITSPIARALIGKTRATWSTWPRPVARRGYEMIGRALRPDSRIR